MPRAVVLNTASKASASGGTFSDSLAANSGDSLAVANFNTGGAKVLEAWVMDSDSVAEGEWIYTRPEATHDQQHGLRFEVPTLALAAAGLSGAYNILPGVGTIDLYKSDTATMTFTCTASDDIGLSWVTLYDDLPGVQGVFGSWAQVQALQKSAVGIQVTAVASTATAFLYGASRAINADDDRLHANTWYAILGASAQLTYFTMSLIGPDWGGQRVGMPGGLLTLGVNTWFVDQSIKWGLPLIPCFNSNNKGNVLINVVDAETSTSPKIDLFLYELTGMPGP
jgi:hypothetical protein